MLHSATQSTTASDPPISIQANHQYLLTEQKLRNDFQGCRQEAH